MDLPDTMVEDLPDAVVEELSRARPDKEVPSITKVRRPSTLGNGNVALILFP